jgi:uncharacterized membrane protein
VNDTTPPPATVPIDPTFSPGAYERVALLLRTGVVGFIALASCAIILELVLHPTASSDSILASGAGRPYTSIGGFVDGIISLQPPALILLGLFVMVAVTVGRVVLAAIDFSRGGERVLTVISAAVVGLLLLGLFVVAPLVR